MDHELLRQTCQEINPYFCPFEKTLLTRQGACSRARRFCLAEREGVHCHAASPQERCLALLALLRQKARFALKATLEQSALPHAKAMRVQVGGLRGLHAVVDPETPVPERIPDIDAILEAAIARFGHLEDIPYPRVMPHIAAYQGRPRSRSRR